MKAIVLSKASESVPEVLLRTMIERSPKYARSLILTGYRGSHAHGTYIPPEDPKGTDDVDTFGVYVRGKEYYYGVSGYNRKDDTFTSAGETLDVESHEIRKYVHLLAKGNPNVHSHLWLEPEDYFSISRAGQILLARRESFLSQRVFEALTGYAYSQMMRMTKFEKQGYMGNKREQIVIEHGYDIKNAAHCIRLLTLGIGLAQTGKLKIKLTGQPLESILAIKKGEWSFEEVQTAAKIMFENLRDIKVSTALPPQVDHAWADQTCAAVIETYHEDRESA